MKILIVNISLKVETDKLSENERKSWGSRLHTYTNWKKDLKPLWSPSEADPSLQRDLNVDPTLCLSHSVPLNFIYDQTSQGDLDSRFRLRGHHRFSSMHQGCSTKCLIWKFASHERSDSHQLDYNFWNTPRDQKMWRRAVSVSHFTFAHKSIAHNKVFLQLLRSLAWLNHKWAAAVNSLIAIFYEHVLSEATTVLTRIQFLPGATYFIDVFGFLLEE